MKAADSCVFLQAFPTSALAISQHTVRSHLKNILTKLNVHDRTAAVIEALRRGILHIDRHSS